MEPGEIRDIKLKKVQGWHSVKTKITRFGGFFMA